MRGVFVGHITVGQPNLPAIVLIKDLFLRLALHVRRHQLHETTPSLADTGFELQKVFRVITGLKKEV